MKRILFASALIAGSLGAGTAFADSTCNVPMADWQPRDALELKLKAQGWEVRRIKTENGCYEVYALDEKGRRIEAEFDPKTFEVVKMEAED